MVASETPTDNNLKASYALQVLTSYLIVAVLAGRVTTNCQLALGVFIVYQLWGLIWIKILMFSPNIYSIKIPTTILDDWVQLSLPSTDSMKVRKDRVVTSISELSGIRGTHMMVALRIMTATMNILILFAIQVDLHHRNSVFLRVESGADMVPICLFIMACGFFCVGHFELNMMDKFHTMGHFLGVSGIFIGATSIGFLMKWNALSTILVALQFGLGFFWFAYIGKVKKRSDDLKVVTRNSKMCIGIELVMFYVTNVILVLVVYSLGPNEGNFMVTPFL